MRAMFVIVLLAAMVCPSYEEEPPVCICDQLTKEDLSFDEKPGTRNIGGLIFGMDTLQMDKTKVVFTLPTSEGFFINKLTIRYNTNVDNKTAKVVFPGLDDKFKLKVNYGGGEDIEELALNCTYGEKLKVSLKCPGASDVAGGYCEFEILELEACLNPETTTTMETTTTTTPTTTTTTPVTTTTPPECLCDVQDLIPMENFDFDDKSGTRNIAGYIYGMDSPQTDKIKVVIKLPSSEWFFINKLEVRYNTNVDNKTTKVAVSQPPDPKDTFKLKYGAGEDIEEFALNCTYAKKLSVVLKCPGASDTGGFCEFEILAMEACLGSETSATGPTTSPDAFTDA